MAFTAALHTYFAVSDIDRVRVEGLDGARFTDSLQGGKELTQEGPVVFREEVDRVYVGTPDDGIVVSERGGEGGLDGEERGAVTRGGPLTAQHHSKATRNLPAT